MYTIYFLHSIKFRLKPENSEIFSNSGVSIFLTWKILAALLENRFLFAPCTISVVLEKS